jgi:hypothetical protein
MIMLGGKRSSSIILSKRLPDGRRTTLKEQLQKMKLFVARECVSMTDNLYILTISKKYFKYASIVFAICN